MRVLNLEQAGQFLTIGEESLRKMAKNGDIKAAFVAGRWLFVDVDLVAWVRSHYNPDRNGESQGDTQCYLNEKVVPIGITNLRLVEKQYTDLLAQPTKRKPKK